MHLLTTASYYSIVMTIPFPDFAVYAENVPFPMTFIAPHRHYVTAITNVDVGCSHTKYMYSKVNAINCVFNYT